MACELTVEDLLHFCWKFCLFHALQCILLTTQLFHSCLAVSWLGLFGTGLLMTFCPCHGVNPLPMKKRQSVKKAVDPEIALRKWIMKVNTSYRFLIEARIIGQRRYRRLRCRTTPVPVWSPTKICFETGFVCCPDGTWCIAIPYCQRRALAHAIVQTEAPINGMDWDDAALRGGGRRPRAVTPEKQLLQGFKSFFLTAKRATKTDAPKRN